MDREQQFHSPEKRNHRHHFDNADFDTGFRTPELCKDKVELLKAKRENIGTMSSFFKRTAPFVSSQSDANSSRYWNNARRIQMAFQDKQFLLQFSETTIFGQQRQIRRAPARSPEAPDPSPNRPPPRPLKSVEHLGLREPLARARPNYRRPHETTSTRAGAVRGVRREDAVHQGDHELLQRPHALSALLRALLSPQLTRQAQVSLLR